MEKRRYKIYCAGPLFNPKEREEMSQIASVLEHAGYSAFLLKGTDWNSPSCSRSSWGRAIPARMPEDPQHGDLLA